MKGKDNNTTIQDVESPLLATLPHEYSSTHLRWWILFLFSLSSFLQCMVWFTFSSIPDYVSAYYGPKMNNATINLILNWGPIIYIPVLPFVSWFQTKKNGLLLAYWLAVILTFAGTVIRTIPCWLPESTRQTEYAFIFLHVGQILNAAAGPLVMATCSKLSVMWFPEHQRGTATAIAYTANSLGTPVGFLMGPHTVHAASDFPTYLYIEMAMAAVPVIGGIIYYRDHPKILPSPAAVIQLEQLEKPAGSFNFFKGIWLALQSPSFIMIVLSGGIISGVTSGWQGVLPQALEWLHYSDNTIGWFGFGSGVAGIIGGIVVGPILDIFFRRRQKVLLVILTAASVICFAWFTLCLPHPPISEMNKIRIPSDTFSIVLSLCAAGFFQGACGPVFFELAAELVFPVPEATSAGLLSLVNNAACLVMLIVGTFINTKWMNFIQTSSILFCLVLVCFVREEYKRMAAEEKEKAALQEKDYPLYK